MKNIILSLKNVSKSYAKEKKALDNVSLDIQKGELFALLGPNGAGKTTLIGCVTGYVKKSSGSIVVAGHDIDRDTYAVRKRIGLVPQELALDIFYTVEDTLKFQRGLYGKKHDTKLLKKTLTSLSLWDKKDTEVRQLSGGMKRRVLIAKALMNEPDILFLDEPTAGVDVELRRSMWKAILKLKESGVTIILTTHYLEEAEEMADRIGIIDKGKLQMVEETKTLLSQFGEKRIDLHLDRKVETLPDALSRYAFEIRDDGKTLRYFASKNDISPHTLLSDLRSYGMNVRDIDTDTTSLEEIFIQLIHKKD